MKRTSLSFSALLAVAAPAGSEANGAQLSMHQAWTELSNSNR